jgi:hypothetical protein
VPKEAIATRKPVNGLDLEPARAYVAALDDPTSPPATLVWRSPSKASIHAPLKPGQVLSLQVSYAPGWHAADKTGPVPVHADALGLIVLEPRCEGDCEVNLAFGVSAEAWVCRVLSALVTLSLLALLANTKRGKNAVENLVRTNRARDSAQGM